jgi:hypothetical protein
MALGCHNTVIGIFVNTKHLILNSWEWIRILIDMELSILANGKIIKLSANFEYKEIYMAV